MIISTLLESSNLLNDFGRFLIYNESKVRQPFASSKSRKHSTLISQDGISISFFKHQTDSNIFRTPLVKMRNGQGLPLAVNNAALLPNRDQAEFTLFGSRSNHSNSMILLSFRYINKKFVWFTKDQILTSHSGMLARVTLLLQELSVLLFCDF